MENAKTEAYSVTIKRDGTTGEILREEWRDPETEELHRHDGPALMDLEEHDGRLTLMRAYYQQGKLHRDDDKPAYTVTDVASGVDVISIWYQTGRHSRDNGSNGSLPAYIEQDPVSRVYVMERYHLNGALHREDGHALIVRDRISGEVTQSSTFLAGKEIVSKNEPPSPTF